MQIAHRFRENGLVSDLMRRQEIAWSDGFMIPILDAMKLRQEWGTELM